MGRAIHPVMVGTAGHIDHGKSSLIRVLTGIDPDRLKEEKERGLTIDLGFAPLKMADGRLLGMIDVPGHERFVRNMVAGSSGLDLVILVIAADDSVMPQTREHLQIVDLLGVRVGIVALTKIDQVDEETLAFAEDEIRELLEGTSLEGADVMPLSSTTGQGIEQFRERLEALAAQVPPRSHEGPFRMPVQRVFTLKGIGAVVTGIPITGSIGVGDVVELLPNGNRSKVRAVHAYGEQVDQAVAGHSTALSVPDAKASQLRRGCVVAAPDVFRVGDAVDVQLTLLSNSPPLKHRAPIRFHTGTIESKGILLLLDRDEVLPGAELNARVILEEKVCGVYGDRFLLRLQNPVVTIGGGQVLRIDETKGRYRRKSVGSELEQLVKAGSGSTDRVRESVTRAGPQGLSPAEIAGALGMRQENVDSLLEELGSEIHFHRRGNRVFAVDAIDDGVALVKRSVDRLLEKRSLAASIRRTALQSSKSLPQALISAVLAKLQEDGEVESAGHGRLLFRSRLKPLSERDQAHLDQLVAICEQAGYRPPKVGELAGGLEVGEEQFAGLVARGVDTGLVEPVGDHVYAATIIRRSLVAIYNNCMRHGEELDIPELRDELGTSRKFLIPLLEYVDSLGMTQFRGGVRRLLPTSPTCQGIAEVVRG